MYYVDALLFVLQSFVVIGLFPFGWCIGAFLDVYSMGASCGWFSWFNFVPDSSMADFRMAGPSGTWFHRFVTVEKVSVILHLCYLLLV
jgi:hypothetical protein